MCTHTQAHDTHRNGSVRANTRTLALFRVTQKQCATASVRNGSHAECVHIPSRLRAGAASVPMCKRRSSYQYTMTHTRKRTHWRAMIQTRCKRWSVYNGESLCSMFYVSECTQAHDTHRNGSVRANTDAGAIARRLSAYVHASGMTHQTHKESLTDGAFCPCNAMPSVSAFFRLQYIRATVPMCKRWSAYR